MTWCGSTATKIGGLMDFDLRTTDSAFDFVQDLLGMTGQQFIHEYMVECEGDYERLWERHYNQLKHIDASRIRIWAFHITGSLDHCRSIKQEGLRNLHYALSTNSAMSRMFRKYGLLFDVVQKTMEFEQTIYDVDYSIYRGRCNLYGRDEQLSSIAYRLSQDYCVNGFMCHDDPASYGFDVHIRPEFIVDLVNMFPQLSELDLEWRRQSTSYKVHFFTYLHQLEGFNFELDNFRDPPYEVWNDLEANDKVIKWMLGRAIARSFDELCEIYLYVKADSFVPPEQISDCERI